jgi:glycosyltransferase involved in cell wall biosynthesis
VFDFDDAIHIGPREKKLRKILPLFACVTPGNPYLAEFARQVNRNVTVWPTVVNTDQYTPTSQRRPGPIRIGWSGSNSTAKYCLPLLEKPLCEIASTHEFEFIIICNSDPQIRWPKVNSRFVPWTPDTEIAGLHEIDLGLMPLKDEAFERGKCGLKAIQYMGIGIPALVSPVGVNSEIVRHGEDGYHCRTAEDWVCYASQLIQNPALRIHMGIHARKRAAQNYSVEALLPKMAATFQQIVEHRVGSRHKQTCQLTQLT